MDAADDLMDLLNEQAEYEKPFREYADKLNARAKALWSDFKPPRLLFCLRGQTAGKAYYDRNEVWLNGGYCQCEAKGVAKDMLWDTLPHELAHILAYQRYGREEGTGHGHGWSAMFGALTGRAPLGRTHHYPRQSDGRRSV